MTWRGHASKIIYEVIKENRGAGIKVMRKALHDAYPYGERKYHPYKIWCDEINRQLGKKKIKSTFVEEKNQLKLF